MVSVGGLCVLCFVEVFPSNLNAFRVRDISVE